MLKDPSANDNEVLRSAIIRNYFTLVYRILLDKRIDPGFDNNFAIRTDASHGNIGIVLRLLQHDMIRRQKTMKHVIIVFLIRLQNYSNKTRA